jgi:hypothetical protein
MSEAEVANVVALARGELASVTERLPTIVDRLDASIDNVEQQLAELKTTRRDVAKMLSTADHEWIDPRASAKPGPKSKSQQQPYLASEQKVKDVQAWLEAHREDKLVVEGFTSKWLTNHEDWNGLPSQSYTSQALRVLHDRGVIRLDRRGTGGSKIFVLA